MSLGGDTSQPLLTLTETETVFILSIDSCIIANDAEDLETIKQQNERYVEVKKITKNKYFMRDFSYVKVNKGAIYSVIVG
jgi:hypothetical protein